MKIKVGTLKRLIKEAAAPPAPLEDLKAYASAFGLDVFYGPQEIATQMDIDESELPPGITEGAAFSDHAYWNFSAFIQNGKLRRLGFESLGEDPADVFDTTLQELMDIGDPRDAQ